jgi:hypothetical protein
MKHLIIPFFFALLLLSSCEKSLEEINVNPNVPLQVTPDLLLPNIIRESVNQTMSENWSIGNIVVQHTAKIQFVNDDRYGWGVRDGIWNTFYSSLRDVNNVLIISRQKDQKNYEAIGLILKSWMYALLTDLYGNVPYSEAVKAKEGDFFPAYDTQEAIYNGILADLKTANDIIGTSNETVSGDILYGGKIANWKKFANSLRMRYLMRISDRKDVSADMKQIIENPSASPVFASNADNAQLTYTKVFPNQFPLHTSRVGSFDEFRLGKHLGDTLLWLNDPRIKVFSRPTAATENLSEAQQVYAGIPNGLDDVTALTYNGGAQFVSRIGKTFFEDAISDIGIAVAKGNIMTYAELQFILAEAARKGLISGNTQSYYEEGIRAGFSMFATSMPSSYLSSPNVAFDNDKALEQIGLQKWISFYFNGIESWIDWRRTGIPTIKPGPANLNNNKVPVRYVYPLSEQSLNEENRKKAIEAQGPDDMNTRVWWDVN